VLVILGVMVINACKKSGSDNNGKPHPLTLSIPPGFPTVQYSFANNPLTQEGFELGRKLFYDGILSKDGNFPCASCHQQFAAFCTYDHTLSHGYNNTFTTRNAPGLFNLAWNKEMMWDGGIANIELQPLAPITGPHEMAEDVNNDIKKLQASSEYQHMFKAAFGDETINSQRMLYALTQYMVSLVSADSKYDKVKAGKATFTSDEQNGYTIFQAKCESCHTEPLFTDHSFRNVGLTVDPYLQDIGRMKITNNPADSLKFKVPSLRNVYLSEPYGHDGRFASIGEVIDHYNNGVVKSPTLDPSLKNGIPINFVEKYYLEQFLRTLTDSTFIQNQRFAQPQ
jgi:cytochrome c peroxidase